jgi:D-ribulokinase
MGVREVRMYVLGLDIGTQGARALICDGEGNILARSAEPFASPAEVELLQPGWAEQSPSDWWNAATVCLRTVLHQLREAGGSPAEIKAVSVDSTSGTVVVLGKMGQPLRPAIMYNDTRASAEASECNSAGADLTEKLAYGFASSFALPKILWVKRNEPELFEKASAFVHAADYIVGRMTGDYLVSDTSNALKTGYDLVDHRWPDFIESDLGIPLSKLPRVANPGDVIGEVSDICSRETGLARGTMVVAGVTDGTSGFLASGAVEVGDWNSTIGTTLVIRGVSAQLIRDAQGRIYSHAHPQGYWLPGGASNCGAECLEKLFHGRDLGQLNAYVPQYSPTSLIVYPLVRTGERFPFVNPNAEGFIIGEPRDSRDLYAAYLEGVAYVERWCYELLGGLGAQIGDTIHTTGGGAKSPEWMQVRANVLNRRVIRPKYADCVLGTAAVAASKTLFSDLETAVKAVVKPGDAMEPAPDRVDAYDQRYRAFRDTCARRGYK